MLSQLAIAIHKRLLSKYTNQLETLLTRLKAERLETISIASAVEGITPTFVQESLQQLEEAVGALEKISTKLEQALYAFAAKLEELRQATPNVEEEFEEYSNATEEILASAFEYTTILYARISAFKAHAERSNISMNLTQTRTRNDGPINSAIVKNIELPTIPIPTFNGDIWDWDNFWELFNTNIHSQNLTELQKFNYLVSSLKGEPLTSIKKFRLSKENYGKAIEFLTNKYGDPEELVLQLYEKLDKTSLRSRSIHEQRTLLEEIQAIIEQLTSKRENVDNQCMYKKVLSKFPSDIQSKVLDKKASTTDRPFNMNQLLLLLEGVISKEERISRYTTNSKSPTMKISIDSNVKQSPKRLSPCMYCRGSHKPFYCDKYKTPQERLQYLQTHKLCLICASSLHSTSQCNRPSCYRCQRRHHTSCCFQTTERMKKPIPFSENEESRKDIKDNKNKQKQSKATKTSSAINQVGENGPAQEKTSSLAVSNTKRLQSTFLPTGEITVMVPTTKQLKKVAVLFDTGAELSFIDTNLANELQLPTMEEIKLRLHTFGSDTIQEDVSRKVPLDVWDAEGNQLSLFLHTHDPITKPFQPPPVCSEDIDFIRKHNLKVDINQNRSTVKPLILLGCDQLWALLIKDKSNIELPSGLHLLPTRLGYLFTGKLKNSLQLQEKDNDKSIQIHQGTNSLQMQEDEEELDKWDGYWTLQGRVNTALLEHPETDEEDEVRWDKYWTLESAGTEEFSNSEKEGKRLMDQKVWENFNKTIEKRVDGYYVRLPWKETPIDLPDNRALALSRLISVWKSLQRDKDLLNMYNSIFEEQIHSNILEEIEEHNTPAHLRIHYIPHQAVLTPNKSTTKLRIVYDASAHYKGCPSLNDVLHRGPVILAQLFGVLLRFRIGRIAITSDVEKAFLQVRLHEDDRDATRCLWLHDHKSPPTPSNIRTLRFTRVTFGLNTSPFLLAGTIHFHLDQHKEDPQLVAEIKDNLYVDNLILTVDNLQESSQIYLRIKQIFKDLNMNLREFVSNNADLMAEMASQDKSEDELPKVLGISWNNNADTLQLSCIIKPQQRITKRTVASVIASIYDPMGFLLPLLHKAKVFLRSLWKDKYNWDNILPEARRQEWTSICAEIHGFTKPLQRCIGTKGTNYTLVTFADASAEAVATCVYLRSEYSTNLLMAKSKLPSLKSSSTIPKMELDAVTLALRLTSAVLTQLRKTLTVTEIFILSDSEIVLSWIKRKPLKKVGLRIFNRLMEIAKIAEHLQGNGIRIIFGHIASQYNAADCATRGLSQQEFHDHFWWTGPPFLQELPAEWKFISNAFEYNESPPAELQEYQHNESNMTNERCTQEEHHLLLARHNRSNEDDERDIFISLKKYSLPNVKRIVALILRCIQIMVAKVNTRISHRIKLSALLQVKDLNLESNISGEEITVAGKILIKHHQMTTITKSMLHSMTHLNVKPDEEGLLRCFGRLGRSDLKKDTKNPLLVIQNSWLAHAIIQHCHSKGHPGISHTMSIVREKFWIPKLRAQVTRILRLCVQCQRFNNLPYKYPEQGDLPQQRVLRSRPFEHVGLDYFGPLTIIQADSTESKCYGAIITCMATRLIHLDVVSDLTTATFLMFLRRFFARRGMPTSIISDNAPTFILAETILNERLQSVHNDPVIKREIANREIQWRHITPFAPWQGGFYERLIKSVKHSLYKSLRTSKFSLEHLSTIVAEIESLLNTRPLLYVESHSPREEVLRPIDFLQNEFEIPYPLDGPIEEITDPSYLPSDARILLNTKQQVIEAVKSSCEITEKFWRIWRSHYLTSLREKHQSGPGKKRSSKYIPKEDSVVLINDPIQPRYLWKMGKIKELVKNSEGIAREAVILLPSQRLIRRPLNLLVPLELDDIQLQETQRDEQSESTRQQPTNQPGAQMDASTTKSTEIADTREQSGRYNLRRQQRVNYRNLLTLQQVAIPHVSLALNILSILAVLGQCSEISSRQPANLRHIRCMDGGVQLISPDRIVYEVCADDYCRTFDSPQPEEILHLPPQVILHEHRIQWKFVDNQSIDIIETTCPPSSFCEHINCILCSTLIFNPECWPLGAIIAIAAALYCIITGCYVLLYVPLTLGRPIRAILSLTWRCIRSLFNYIFRRRRTRHQRRTIDIAKLLAIVAIAFIVTTKGCQQVNLFSYTTTVCTQSDKGEICKVQLSELLKINPFKKEACFKLLRNETLLHEVRVSWKSLVLSCEPESDLFTRDTSYQIVDSKRCPHTGSCKGTKCAGINATSLLPELDRGNKYPGVTHCVESCGGPGCDCFYWSSGCLFYRIYLLPTSPKVYEIFHCNRWKESAKIEITHMDAIQRTTESYVAYMQPNIPFVWKFFTFTLSSVTVPPIPRLNTPFLSDGNHTAVWDSQIVPPLQCQNQQAAESLNCEVVENCACTPAETQANCNCKELNISTWFNNIKNRLPVTLPSLTFHQTYDGQIRANIPSMTTAEVILSIQDELKTDVLMDRDICNVDNTVLHGCYRCAKGAQAQVICISSKPIQAEVVCTTSSFTIPCDKDGKKSVLHFSFNNARVKEKCDVSCGSTITTFEIGGILKFTNIANKMFSAWLDGKPSTESEIQWPDFWHITDIFLNYYKTLLAVLILLALIFALTYIYLPTCALQAISCIFNSIMLLLKTLFHLIFRTLKCAFHQILQAKPTSPHTKDL